MKKLKIKEAGAGKWADPDTNVPQIVIAEGDEVTVSDELAGMMVPNCAEIIEDDIAEEVVEQKPAADTSNVIKTGAEDKADAEQKPAAKDKGKAEKKADKKDK